MTTHQMIEEAPTRALSAVRRETSRSFLLPFLVAAIAYIAVTVLLLVKGYRASEGHLIYALDDTYIGMTMAKNLALHGVWGVSPYEFTSSTSTPFFITLLAGVYRIFGVHESTPLVLSWSFGLAVILVAARMLARYATQVRSTATLLAVVLLTPLFVLGILGMEHTLQILLTLLFLEHFQDKRWPWLIAAITVLMVGTRYEGLFFAFAAAVLLVLTKKIARAALIVISAAFPVVAYAAASILNGGNALPNSVILKGVALHHVSLLGRLQNVLERVEWSSLGAPYLPLMFVGIALLAALVFKSDRKLGALGLLVFGAGCLHMMSAEIGWCYRYEDYLIASGIVVLVCLWHAVPIKTHFAARTAVVLFLLAGTALLARCLQAAANMPKFSRAIYLQQAQTSDFLHTYYSGASIAANDIGIINFRTDLHCLDLVGLASRDVFLAKRDENYSTETLGKLASAHGVKVAIVYDSWFIAHPQVFLEGPILPSSWVRVARWKVPERLQLGGDTVSFYAVDPSETGRLRANIAEFEKRLPSSVTVLPVDGPVSH